MISKLASFISECPYLLGQIVKPNFLGKEAGMASLERIKDKRIIREYADGGTLVGNSFVLALRESFGLGDLDNSRVSDKCLAIENWIEEQNLAENTLKEKVGGNIASVGVAKCFELVRSDGASARYEAEIEVVCLMG